MGLKDDTRAMKKEEYCESSSNNNNINDDSEASSLILSSSYSYLTSSNDLADDAISSSSSSTSSTSSPLYELAELMAQLPIKRGLSKYYNGKSESFASLASDHDLRSVEDLAKKDLYGGGCSYSKRMSKSCKSYGAGSLNQYKFGPKATITKRPHQYKGSFSPSLPAKTYHTNAPKFHLDQPNY